MVAIYYKQIERRILMKKIIPISLILTVIVLCMTACGTKSLNTQDYCNISVSGLNGYGKISLEANYDAIGKDAFVDKKSSEVDMYDSLDTIYNIEYKADKTENLSNGDKITVTIHYDEKSTKDLGFTFNKSSFTYKIDGLKEGTLLDVFEGLSVNFNGIAPKANIIFDNNGCSDFVKDNVTFFSDNYTFRNGDKVKIKARYDEHIATDAGYIIQEAEKEYSINGLSEYPKNIDGLDMSAADDILKEKTEKKYSDSFTTKLIFGKRNVKNVKGDKLFNGNYWDTWEITDVTFSPVKKMYFSLKDDNVSSNKENMYTIIWQIDITAKKTKQYEFGYNTQYPVGETVVSTHFAESTVSNIVKTPDGKLDSDCLTNTRVDMYSTASYGLGVGETPDTLMEDLKSEYINSYDFFEVN